MRRRWLWAWLVAELLLVLPLGARVLDSRRNLGAEEVAYSQLLQRLTGPGPPSADMTAAAGSGALVPTSESIRLLWECAHRTGAELRTLTCSGVERGSRLCMSVSISTPNTRALVEFLREVRKCLPVTVGLEKLDFFDQSRDVPVRLDWIHEDRGVGR